MIANPTLNFKDGDVIGARINGERRMITVLGRADPPYNEDSYIVHEDDRTTGMHIDELGDILSLADTLMILRSEDG